MARKRVSKGSVIVKKEEKFRNVIENINGEITEEKFIIEFKDMYPEAWDRIVKKYNEHERLTKPGKTHPMPEPNKYMSNVYRDFMKKINKSKIKESK
ncbi:hypothetical protein [Wukongibacter sp. M2B1]|uniref:hypothetical protein n=1 Tax=Wukongibacter sp. M2B1 TaxID=3088895 RepID=UPI003D79E682